MRTDRCRDSAHTLQRSGQVVPDFAFETDDKSLWLDRIDQFRSIVGDVSNVIGKLPGTYLVVWLRLE